MERHLKYSSQNNKFKNLKKNNYDTGKTQLQKSGKSF